MAAGKDVSIRIRCMGQKTRTLRPGDRLTIGREPHNDIVLADSTVSRSHAEIEYRQGRFRLTDKSSNGTVVLTDDGRLHRLRRDHTHLSGSGRICLGGLPEDTPDAVIRYECV